MSEPNISYGAEEYAESKQLPFRTEVEKHTIFQLAGDVRGLRVLDAGCGDGIYSRELVSRGASHVLGVDGSQDFIDLAIKKSKGISELEFTCSLIQDFSGKGDMDLVIGSYILSYPKSLIEAIQYTKAIASHLKKGGRFVGFNNNPRDIFTGVKFKEYGCEKEMHGPVEGSKVIYRVSGMQSPITNYYLNEISYIRAFREAGFSDFKFEAVQLNPSERQNNYPHWRNFFKNEPPFIAMVAVK